MSNLMARKYRKNKSAWRKLKKAIPVKVVSQPRRRPNLNTLKTLPILPIKHRCKLVYNDSRTITPTTTNSTAYVYSANGLYDPDITGAGHQPMGFDQLMALYEHYTVTKCKLTVNFVNEDTNDNAYVGLAIFPDSTVETTATKLIENGLMKRSWIAPFDGNPKSQTTLSMSVDISRINGRPKPIIGDDLFRGDSASNPSEQTYIHIFGYNNATVNPCQIRFDVILEYEAVFTEPRKLAQS